MLIDCPHCGKKTSDLETACVHCNKSLSKEPEIKKDEIKKEDNDLDIILCPSCGKVIKEKSTVCEYCGLENVQVALKKQEKEEAEVKKIVEQADEIHSRINVIKKNCSAVWWVLSILGLVLFAFSFFEVKKISESQDVEILLALRDSELKIKVMFVGGFFMLFVGSFFETSLLDLDGLPLVAYPFVLKEMEKVNFSSFDFLKKVTKIYKRDVEHALEEDENGDMIARRVVERNVKIVEGKKRFFVQTKIQAEAKDKKFLTLTRIKHDEKEKKVWIIKRIIPYFALLLSYVFFCVTISNAVGDFVNAILMNQNYSFDFTSVSFILACFLMLLWIVLHIVLNRREEKESLNWFKKMKNK